MNKIPKNNGIFQFVPSFFRKKFKMNNKQVENATTNGADSTKTTNVTKNTQKSYRNIFSM